MNDSLDKRCGTCVNARLLEIYDESPKRFKCPVYDQVVRSIDGRFCPSWREFPKKDIKESV